MNIMRDIGLSLTPRTNGRAAVEVRAERIRDLTTSDLTLLESERGTQAPPLKKLRDVHHKVARLLAQGFKPGVVATLVGYSNSRVSILQNDPAFQELVQSYRDNTEMAFIDFQTAAAGLKVDAVLELRDRLEENPEKFDNKELNDLIKTVADRTGDGPQSRSTNVNVNVDLAGRLERGLQRLQAIEVGPTPPRSDEEPVT